MVLLSLPVLAEETTWGLQFKPQIAAYAADPSVLPSLDISLLKVNDLNYGIGFNQGVSVFIDKDFISNTTIGIFLNGNTRPSVSLKIGAYL